jgi:2-polyprenyl-3-methyl-5-hydroxy-6-metoxy-1,4-benzoquinol methylase
MAGSVHYKLRLPRVEINCRARIARFGSPMRLYGPRGIYARAGDYHRNLDSNWSCMPTYLRKMAFVRAFVTSLPRSTKFIDIACGEGVLVEDFRNKGWRIEGLDLNYESEFVRQGDIRAMPYGDGSSKIGLTEYP